MFALFHQPRFQPPDQRVEPEDGFHHHVDRGGQIIVAAHVAQFVGENGFQVRIFKAFGDSFGPYQNRPGDAENSRFQRSLRHQHFGPLPHPSHTLQPAQGLHFASFF